ncbi:MAG TPA: hypothetical protein VNN73_11470 [Blastocatellia bacterium]|nr:hypothetical protein [Blastocatellia bacterium]
MRKLWPLTFMILYFSCRASAPTANQQGDDQPPPSAVVASQNAPVNSGRKLAGEFVLKVETDDYGAGGERAVYRFDESGAFTRRQVLNGSPANAEEGVYVISASGELVLYIEKVEGALLEAARVERYSIKEESGARLILQADRAGSFILEKK